MSNSPDVSNYDTVIRASLPHKAVDAVRAAAKANNKSFNSYVVSAVYDYIGVPVPAEKPPFGIVPASSCVICGNPLPNGKARYCSDECKREGHRRTACESLRCKGLSSSHPAEIDTLPKKEAYTNEHY